MAQLQADVGGDTKPAFNRSLAVAMLILALNLRVPFLAVTPLFPFIKLDYGLSNSVISLLTVLPLFVFAMGSFLASFIAERWGIGRTLMGGLCSIFVGEIIRYVGGEPGLFIGTVCLSAGIVLGNVLLPSLIRGFFTGHVGLMTGAYSTLAQVATTLFLAFAVPLTLLMGWHDAVMIVSIAAVVALALWWPYRKLELPKRATDNAVGDGPKRFMWQRLKALYSQPLAWQISFFMGLQSLVFFCSATWIPTLAISRGLTPTQGGLLGFLLQGGALICSFLTPLVMARVKKQSVLTACITLLNVVGLVLLLNSTTFQTIAIATLVISVAVGSTFVIGLMYFVVRSPSAQTAALVSGTGQSIGYTLAALGPLMMGVLVDITGTWSVPITVVICIVFVCAWCGYLGGRQRVLKEV
ncbi:MAG: MFS transporter [Veillonella sp.]|nr:MFS transporter [Veillonella sp.]